MDRELIYYYQKALLIAVNDDLSIRGISQFGLSPIASGRLQQNIYLRKYTDNLKMMLFDRYMVVEKSISKGYAGKPLVYTEMGDKGLRDYVDREDREEVLNFRHWYGDYYLLTGLLPSGGRDNDHILVINKVFYP